MKKAFLFGYGQYSIFVASELKKDNFQLIIVVENKIDYDKALKDGYSNVSIVDIENDDKLINLDIQLGDYLICMMEDDHLNIFLTLSLHSLFPDAIIIALSNSLHAMPKLKMAGATRVIDTYQVSSNRIYNIIENPIATKLMDSLLSTEDNLSFREIDIPDNSFLDKQMVIDFDFSIYHIILIGMIDRRLSDKFIFITTGLEHRLDIGDTIVCIGYNNDLDNFEEHIKKRNIE